MILEQLAKSVKKHELQQINITSANRDLHHREVSIILDYVQGKHIKQKSKIRKLLRRKLIKLQLKVNCYD